MSARVPSGEKLARRAESRCPARIDWATPVWAAQTRAVPSRLAVMTESPSLLNRAVFT